MWKACAQPAKTSEACRTRDPKSGYTGSCKTPQAGVLVWGFGGERTMMQKDATGKNAFCGQPVGECCHSLLPSRRDSRRMWSVQL